MSPARKLGGLPLVLAVLAALAPALILSAGATAAAGLPSFSLQPSPARTPAYFIFRARPGDKLTGTLALANVGRERGTAALYAVDATTANSGGASYLSKASPRRDVGRWLRLSFSRAALDPRQEAQIPFRLTVPKDATPGQHLGGVVAEESGGGSGTGVRHGGFQIRIQHLSIVAVEVIVAGPSRLGVHLTGIRASMWGNRQTIVLGLRNTGTLMVKPTGTLLVFAAHHRLVERIALQIDTFLPRTSIEYPIFVPGRALPAGTYTTALTLHYGTRAVTRGRQTFTIRAN